MASFFVRFLAETGLSSEGDAAGLRFLVLGVSASAGAGLFVESLRILVWGVSSDVERKRDLPSVFAAAGLPVLTPSLTLRLHHEQRAECRFANPASA